MRGQDKVVRRQGILDHLRSLTQEARAELVARKEAEAARLPERDADLPSRAPATPGTLSRAETERRRAALASAQKAEVGRDPPRPAGQPPVALPAGAADPRPDNATESSREFVPESTTQDSVIELIAEIQELRGEVASLRSMLQAVFKNI